MTTIEHLQRIKSRCQELLATAETRTPGKWVPHFNTVATRKNWWDVASTNSHECVGHEDCPMIHEEEKQSNANFIASCAGPAEAGWRATIAAIECALMILETYAGRELKDIEYVEFETAKHLAKSVINAWPEEVLS